MLRRLLRHPSRQIHENKLVFVDIQVRGRVQGRVRWAGRIQKFSLGADRNELAGTHRKRTRKQARNAREHHDRRRNTRSADTQHEREIGHKAIVRAEHRGTEITREPHPPLGR